MKKFRKLIVKQLALSYRIRLFGKEFTYVRAANIIVPIMLLLGYSLIAQLEVLKYISLFLTAVVWGLTIGYLKLKPVKWEELDTEQKWFYGNAAVYSRIGIVLSNIQHLIWKNTDNKYKTDNTKFHNVKVFLVNPIALVLFIIALLTT